MHIGRWDLTYCPGVYTRRAWHLPIVCAYKEPAKPVRHKFWMFGPWCLEWRKERPFQPPLF